MPEKKVGDIVHVRYRDPDTGEEVEIRTRVVQVTDKMVRMVEEKVEAPDEAGDR